MCGIAGLITKNGAPAEPGPLRPMLRSIVHRGPDAEGTFVRGPVALGHRRLSILDTSDAGTQPMHFEHFTVVFNGEIYNYLEIRDELQRHGHRFITGTDTEVFLHACAEWGESCLDRLAGMWAFALLDGLHGTLLLSRDRFGIKPLYWVEQPSRWLFASEIKALLAADVSPKMDEATLSAYLASGLEDFSDRTFFDGIHQLTPGQNLVIDLAGGGGTFKQYYCLDRSIPSAASMEEYQRTLRDSVRIHLRSDVRVATCLSGGLDSSTVAALASRDYAAGGLGPFTALTAQSEDPANDESAWAESVARHCGLHWLPKRPSYEDFESNLETCLRTHDEPVTSPSVFLQFWIMRAAHQEGIKVMLDGQGGDETLLGYERYYPVYFRDRLRTASWSVVAGEYRAAVRNSGLTLPRLAGLTAYFSLPFARRLVRSMRSGYLKPHYRAAGLAPLREMAAGCGNLRTMQLLEIGRFQLPHLLRYEDRNSMTHSVEARVPFLDHRCVETAIALAPEDKIHNGFSKYALRMLAEQVLPFEVAWRTRKIGFEAPERLWYRRHQATMQAAVAGSAILRRMCRFIPDLTRCQPPETWRLFNTALWERLTGVSAS